MAVALAQSTRPLTQAVRRLSYKICVWHKLECELRWYRRIRAMGDLAYATHRAAEQSMHLTGGTVLVRKHLSGL